MQDFPESAVSRLYIDGMASVLLDRHRDWGAGPYPCRMSEEPVSVSTDGLHLASGQATKWEQAVERAVCGGPALTDTRSSSPQPPDEE
jgi:hypothetical protein